MTLGRRMMNVGLAASGLVWAVVVVTIGAQAPSKSVNDGVYSSGQAGPRGEALFQLSIGDHVPQHGEIHRQGIRPRGSGLQAAGRALQGRAETDAGETIPATHAYRTLT